MRHEMRTKQHFITNLCL